jgi:hypothetical protein
MTISICDIEADGFLDTITKIHCISVYYQDSEGNWIIKSTTDYEDMRRYFLKENQTIVMHYGVCYDIPAVKKILGVELPKSSKVIDSCAVSFALYPDRTKRKIGHSLESWGENFGVPKKAIDDWENLPIEEYILRCEQDIRINLRLWQEQWSYLCEIYDNDHAKIIKYCYYLTFKMECLRDQEQVKVRISLDRLKENLEFFNKMREEKIEELRKVMPRVPSKVKRVKPKVMYKKDGSLSAVGEKWMTMLNSCNLPQDYEGVIEEVVSWSEPNPQSVDQLKDWLVSLGWVAETFESRKNTKGEIKEVPQINIKENLCPSVERLIEKEPAIEHLSGLGIIKHRLGVLKAFDRSHVDGYVVAGASAFTNTLRLQHISPIANLPKYTGDKDIRDGYYIRGLLIAPDGYEICGSDMKSLEDRVKQLFLFPYDEQYVRDMMVEGFDPHLDLAVSGGALTVEQAEAHKSGEENYKEIRHIYKTGNYTCQFGAGAPRISKTLGISLSEAKKVHEAYWSRNKGIKLAANASKVITVREQMWLLNPINGYYYSLRNTKDIFSVLCQGGGVYIFDMWLYHMRQKGVIPALQYHDEKMSYIKKGLEGERALVTAILKNSVGLVNKQLNLDRDMDVDVQFGDDYSQTH